MSFENHQNILDDRFDIVSIYQDVLSGRRKIFPQYTWAPAKGGYDNFRRCFRYLVLEKLNLTREEYITVMGNSQKFALRYKLTGGYCALFGNSSHKLTDFSFPEWNVKVWELSRDSANYWTVERGIEAFKWMIEEKLGWSDQDIINNLGVATFQEFGIYRMLWNTFSDSYCELLKLAYPDRDWSGVSDRVERYNLYYSRAKLKKSEVSEIRNMYINKKMTNKEIAVMFGVSTTTISNINSGLTYSKEDKPNEDDKRS